MEFFISLRSSSIRVLQFGSGEKLLICFHGFGESAEKFETLNPSLGDLFTVVAIDLPFHGKTRWEEGDLFLLDDLKTLIQFILEREQQQRFSLMGYSLGGKIVLATVPHFVAFIDRIILVAPDGVIKNAWYNVAVYPEWGRTLFIRFVVKPQFIFSVAQLLKMAGLLSSTFFKFIQVQTNTEEKRRKVYNVWTTIKDFEVDLKNVKNLLNIHHIKSLIFIGKYDKVITQQTGKKFAEGLQDCKYILLEKGHNLITESLNEPLQKALRR